MDKKKPTSTHPTFQNLVLIFIIGLLSSCSVFESAKLSFRKMKRSLFPPSCNFEVALDLKNYNFFDDRYNTNIEFSTEVEEEEFIPAIHFEPAVEYYKTNYPNNPLTRYGSRFFSLESWNIKPGIAYKITIDPFFSKDDCKFSQTLEFKLPAKNYRPNFWLTENNVIESESNRILPIQVSNLDNLNIEYSLVNPAHLVSAISNFELKYSSKVDSVSWKKINWKVNNKYNSNGEIGFPLDNLLGKDKQAWILMRVSQKVVEYGSIEETLKSSNILVQSTNIGITSKEDNENIYVWLNSLSKAEPVEGAEVTLYTSGSNSGVCRTNQDGYCSIPKFSQQLNSKKSVIVAEKGNDKSFLYFENMKLYQPYSYYDRTNQSAKIYFDRKLYRPGEKVEIKALLGERSQNNFLPYANKSATVKITNTRGQEVVNSTLVTSEQGGLWLNYSIPKEAPLGHYTVYINTAGSKSYLSSDSFQVEEFRPVSFGVTVTSSTQQIIAKDSFEFDIQANYLFGTPMGGAKYKYSILKKSYTPDIQGYDKYSFGYEQDYYDYYESEYEQEDSSGYLSGDEGELDSQGHAKVDSSLTNIESIFETSNDKITIVDPFKIQIEATVKDVDAKSITNTHTIHYLPSNNLIGIQCEDRYKSIKDTLKFKIVGVPIDPKKVETFKATAYIIHNNWSSVESKGFIGSLFRTNSLDKKTLDSKTIKLSGEAINFDYSPKHAGSHSLLIVDDKGSYSRMDFYVYKRDSFYAWDFRSDDSIQLSSDKPKYNIGDVAKVIIQSPYPEARAIISVERDGVYWSKSIHLKGNSEPISIPIKPEYLPNVEFNVILLTGRTPPPKDLSEKDLEDFVSTDYGVPKVKIGSIQLTVNTDTKIAPVELIFNKEVYSPREEIKIKIKTLPKSEVLISVADRGILDLVNYRFTNPVSQFYKLWNSIVRSFDIRDWIVKQSIYTGKGDNPGGDYGDDQSDGGFGKESEDGTRKDFKPTAYWNPNIKTDSNGEAEIKFTLPDNLTTFRVMASVSQNGNYGAENKEFLVKKSLILKKSAPRFVRINDTISVGATITNNTKIKGKFKVNFDSKDLDLKNSNQILELDALQTKEIASTINVDSKLYETLNKKFNETEIELTYKVSVEPENFELYTKSGIIKSDIKDAIEVKFPFKKPEPVISNRISGYTDSSESFAINFPSVDKVLLREAGFDFNVSGTVLTGLKSAFDFYGSNPYYCMEQRTSAYLLSISSGHLLNKFGYKPPNSDSYDFNNIEKLFVNDMPDFQNSDGSFRLWKESSVYGNGYPYLTAYVIYTMQMAKKYNYKINEQSYKLGLKYLISLVKTPKESEEDSYQTLSLVYSILARDGLDTLGLDRTLMDNFSKLNPKSQGIFLSAIYDARGLTSINQDAQLKKLYQSYISQFKFNKDSVDLTWITSFKFWLSYYSKGSAYAALLTTMIRIEPDHKSLPVLIRFILSSKAGNLWLDTQSSATLAFALREYRDKFEATDTDTEASIKIGSKTLMDLSIGSDDNSILSKYASLGSLASDWKFPSKDLIFQRTSEKGRLYFNSALKYIPYKDEQKASSNGIKIQKQIYSINGKDSDGEFITKEANGTLKRGTSYLVKLRISTDVPRNFVMIQDYIPSNAEVVNTKFKTESSEYSSLDGEESNDGDWWTNSPAYIEYRDDKVLFSKDYLDSGDYEFTYLLRPLSKGKSVMPAAKAIMMYDSTIYGNTSTNYLQVE
ncbi:MAG: MG2 domain-containing protein [Leptospiraceae bacterium]|nr:MG2 domain-containing protein [Leptospiraceae bacterium]